MLEREQLERLTDEELRVLLDTRAGADEVLPVGKTRGAITALSLREPKSEGLEPNEVSEGQQPREEPREKPKQARPAKRRRPRSTLDAMPLEPNAFVGRRVSKQFGGDGRFEGRVAAYDATHGYELHYEEQPFLA